MQKNKNIIFLFIYILTTYAYSFPNDKTGLYCKKSFHNEIIFFFNNEKIYNLEFHQKKKNYTR